MYEIHRLFGLKVDNKEESANDALKIGNQNSTVDEYKHSEKLASKDSIELPLKTLQLMNQQAAAAASQTERKRNATYAKLELTQGEMVQAAADVLMVSFVLSPLSDQSSLTTSLSLTVLCSLC